MEEDLIIDVIVNRRVLLPKEIPPAVAAEIEAALTDGRAPEEIIHEGVRYRWSVRPCVYP
ncbi:MAG: hypothetical protein ACREQ3_11385 [Candidatus Binatia bacterium]